MTTAGFIKPGFEKLRDLFEQALAESHQGGAALSVRVDGKQVASLWGGFASPNRKWEEDTPSVVFSVTKGIVTVLLADQVTKGRIELDKPVAHYWPEFAQAGKADTTVRELLAHKAGLSALREDITVDQVVDWDFMVSALAKEAPLFDKSNHQYHALTFGWLVGEILRRVTGLGIGELLQRELSKPLGINAWIGIPSDLVGKVALLQQTDFVPAENIPELQIKAMTLGGAFPENLMGVNEGFNNPRIQMAEVPGAGGIFDANALSKIYSACVSDKEPIRLLNDAVIADMTKEQSSGPSQLEKVPPFPRWGSGFMIPSEHRAFMTEASFGHDGFGGQVVFADAKHKVGFAFITNDLQSAGDQRGNRIVTALGEILSSR